MTGPLDGIRILDLTAMITGPLATMILADQGAEVIKVEPPGLGDVMRYLGTQRGGMSGLFATCNRGKRSIALNLREERGREIAQQLAVGVDVVVQNFRPGVVERLGLGEPTLRGLRPELIYVSISAFGATGPYAQRPAYDHVIQGMSGAAVVQGSLGETPEYVRNAFCDKVTALTASQAITAALLARERGAGGQHLRLSMLDAAIAFLWPDGMSNHTILEADAVQQPSISVLYRLVTCPDGFISVAAVTDAQFRGVCRAIGRPEVADDPRFATLADRQRNFKAAFAALEGGADDLPMAEALRRLEAEDVPCGPILALEELPTHPQVLENGTLVESEHPRMGRLREPRPPVRFSDTPAEIRGPAPALGQHTDDVLGALGLAPGEIADLRAKGIAS